jgi:hypothetical protein
MIFLLADYNEALDNAAKAGGVNVNDLPAEVIAPIHHDYIALWQLLLIFGAIAMALALFIAVGPAVARARVRSVRLSS